MFEFLKKLFKRTEIPYQLEVEKIVKDVKDSGYKYPCSRISARIARMYIAKGLDATVYSGVLRPDDRRVKSGYNRQHAIVVVAIDGKRWVLDATTIPMTWSDSRPSWVSGTEYVCSRYELLSAKPGNIWY